MPPEDVRGAASVLRHERRGQKENISLGHLDFDFAQHRQTLRPTLNGTRSKALRPFGSQ